MRLRSLLTFSLGILVAIAAFTTYSYFGRSGDQPQSANVDRGRLGEQPQGANVDQNYSNIIWSISSEESGIPQKDVSNLKEAFYAHVSGGESDSPDNTDLEILSGKVEGDVGVLYGGRVYHESQEVVPSEGVVFLVHKVSGTWQVVSPGDRNFCRVLQQLPSSIMSEEAKYYFGECR